MNLALLHVFQEQVVLQCRMVIWAYQDVQAALVEMETIDNTPLPHVDYSGPDVEGQHGVMSQAHMRRRDAMFTASWRLWFALQNLVVSSGNVAKALWGQSSSRTKRLEIALRRKPLRDSFEVDDTSPLRPLMMRNNFEHFDDRLDKWNQSGLDQQFDLFVQDSRQPLADSPPNDLAVFRWFSPDNGILTFWGDQFDTRAIAAEAQRLLSIAEVKGLGWA